MLANLLLHDLVVNDEVFAPSLLYGDLNHKSQNSNLRLKSLMTIGQPKGFIDGTFAFKRHTT